MVFSYSALTNYGKITLPAVEGWNTSNNIIKDPPKSVHTRRIDKVGETPHLNTLLSESGDRVCEAINYYARGVNPMVSVSYGQGQQTTGPNAYLPYRVIRDGAFRPPITRQQDLVPLSRLPRIWTSMHTLAQNQHAPIDLKTGTSLTELPRSCGDIKKVLHSQALRVAWAGDAPTPPGEPHSPPAVSGAHIVQDPLVPGEYNAACHQDLGGFSHVEQKPALLAPVRTTQAFATPYVGYGATEAYQFDSTNYGTRRNHPTASAFTNMANPSFGTQQQQQQHVQYDRLPVRQSRGALDGSVSMHQVAPQHVLPRLVPKK